jgi:sugar phosphate isomerase/epimerase
MAGIPIGLQLFSVRGECEKDLPAAVKAVSELGYTGAEPWGYNGQTMEWMGHSAADA